MQTSVILVCVIFMITSTLGARMKISEKNIACPCKCISFLEALQTNIGSCGSGDTIGCVTTMCRLGSENGLGCCEPSQTTGSSSRASSSPVIVPSPVTPSPTPSPKDLYRASLYVAASYATVFINGLSFSATRWGALHALVPKLGFGDVIALIVRGGRAAMVVELDGLTFVTGTDDFRVALPFGEGKENSTWMMPSYDQGCGWHPAEVASVNYTLPAYPKGKGAQSIWFSEASEEGEIFLRYVVGAPPCPEGSESAGFDDGSGKNPLPSAEVTVPPLQDNEDSMSRKEKEDELALWRRTVMKEAKSGTKLQPRHRKPIS